MLYPRKIQQEIGKWLLRDEIIILNGSMQAGKTSLLKLLRDDLESKKIEKERLFYLNLEELDVLNDLNISPRNILNYIICKNRQRCLYF